MPGSTATHEHGLRRLIRHKSKKGLHASPKHLRCWPAVARSLRGHDRYEVEERYTCPNATRDLVSQGACGACALDAIGYAGAVSLEILPAPSDEEAARRGIARMRELWESTDAAQKIEPKEGALVG